MREHQTYYMRQSYLSGWMLWQELEVLLIPISRASEPAVGDPRGFVLHLLPCTENLSALVLEGFGGGPGGEEGAGSSQVVERTPEFKWMSVGYIRKGVTTSASAGVKHRARDRVGQLPRPHLVFLIALSTCRTFPCVVLLCCACLLWAQYRLVVALEVFGACE